MMKWNRLLLTSILTILLLFLGACSNPNEKEEATTEETSEQAAETGRNESDFSNNHQYPG